ncbi:MAG: 5-oxoprolinase subunit PxpA, partial [Cyanobacteriota bacterium]
TIKKEQPQQKTIYVDLNCDLGEGFGIYQNNKEKELIPFVSSVNIPCGAHAGDPIKIMEAIKLAKANTLSIGAHIGYPDIASFGYREMNLSFEELKAMIIYQIGALKAIAASYNMQIDYVRPHGALYRQMTKDAALAISVAKSLEEIDTWLILVGAAGDALNNVQEETKIRVAPEIIINKYYDDDGSILFDEPVEDIEKVLMIATKLVKEGKMISKNGNILDIDFKTIHLCSDSDRSIQIAKEIRGMFPERPVPIAITLVGDHALHQVD